MSGSLIPCLLYLSSTLQLKLPLKVHYLPVEDLYFLLVSLAFLSHFLPRLFQLCELLDLPDEFLVELLVVLLLNLGVSLHVLNDLLLLQILLAETLDKHWINLWLGHLSLQQNAQPLRLLHIEGQLGLVLFYLGELQSLLEVCEFLLFEHVLLVDLFDFELQSGNLAVLGGQSALLGHLCTRHRLELHTRTLGKKHGCLLANIMVDLPLLELLEELIICLHLLARWHEYLLHDLLNHIVFLANVRMLALHLCFELLIGDRHLVDLLLQFNLLLVQALLVGVLHALGEVGSLI